MAMPTCLRVESFPPNERRRTEVVPRDRSGTESSKLLLPTLQTALLALSWPLKLLVAMFPALCLPPPLSPPLDRPPASCPRAKVQRHGPRAAPRAEQRLSPSSARRTSRLHPRQRQSPPRRALSPVCRTLPHPVVCQQRNARRYFQVRMFGKRRSIGYEGPSTLLLLAVGVEWLQALVT